MNSRTTFLTIAIFVAALGAIGFTVRSLIDFGNISSYIQQEKLVGMTYDLIYFYSWIQIIFLGITLVMLMYLISVLRTIKEENSLIPKPPKLEKPKRTEKKKGRTKRKKKEAESGMTRDEWRRLYKEAEKSS